jgi:hypothetical protein
MLTKEDVLKMPANYSQPFSEVVKLTLGDEILMSRMGSLVAARGNNRDINLNKTEMMWLVGLKKHVKFSGWNMEWFMGESHDPNNPFTQYYVMGPEEFRVLVYGICLTLLAPLSIYLTLKTALSVATWSMIMTSPWLGILMIAVPNLIINTILQIVLLYQKGDNLWRMMMDDENGPCRYDRVLMIPIFNFYQGPLIVIRSLFAVFTREVMPRFSIKFKLFDIAGPGLIKRIYSPDD